MDRTGNAALLLIIVVGAAAAGLYMSPELAETVLPPRALGAHPAYDAANSDATCTDIEQIEEGEEAIRDLLGTPAEDGSTTRNTVCAAACDTGQYVTDYCDNDDQFICVCRTENTA